MAKHRNPKGYMGRTTHSEGAYSPMTHSNIYKIWANLFLRCYSSEFHLREPSYIGCTVCEEWHDFQNFARFYDTAPYREDGWHLDKDILCKGNKIYAPDKCVFVPPEINKLFVRRSKYRGDTPQGVHYEKRRNRYKASMHDGSGKTLFLGRYRTVEEAFDAYKKAKESRICAVANKYKERISPDLYQAMINYKIDITD